jgi:hypothetical protein
MRHLTVANPGSRATAVAADGGARASRGVSSDPQRNRTPAPCRGIHSSSKARIGKNPQTGQPIAIPPHRAARFGAGSRLKNAVK